MGEKDLPKFIRENYELRDYRHALAVLIHEFKEEFYDIVNILSNFRLNKNDVIVGGGGKSPISQKLDKAFVDRGWAKKVFVSKQEVDGNICETSTHEVDCFKNGIALEVEWNNKDTFFDRDLRNFRYLYDLRIISLGVIITRSTDLRTVFNQLRDRDGKNVGDKFCTSTTHMAKLAPKLEQGASGGCPVAVFGITSKLYVDK
jgi:hypothetical protein